MDRTTVIASLLVLATSPVGAEIDRPAALLTYPYVVVDAGTGVDTTLHLSSISNAALSARCFYENANSHCSNAPAQVCARNQDCNGGRCLAGWSSTEFLVQLSRQQPIAWRASQGCNSFGCTSPPVPEQPFVGSMTCFAVDGSGAPIAVNDLTGGATLDTVVSGTLDVARYNAIGMEAFVGSSNGDAKLILGGFDPEYDGCPNFNLLSHFFDGSPDPVSADRNVHTTLVALPCTRDPFPPGNPGQARIQLQVFNEFEQPFGAFVDFSGLLHARLSTLAPKAFDAAVTGTLTGRTRILSSGSGVMAIAIEERHSGNAAIPMTRAAVSVHIQGLRAQPDVIGGAPGECGDGRIDAGEACDDGNTNAGDCCSSTCQLEASGSPCTSDDNACTRDVCNTTGRCTHPLQTPPPAGCGCCQVQASNFRAPFPCTGDCDGDGKISEREVEICADIAAGRPTLDCFDSCDAQGDFVVTPADVAIARENQQHGCPSGAEACFAPADAEACGFTGNLVAGLTCDRRSAGSDEFGCAAAATPEQATINGTCQRPGMLGLESCAADTPISLMRCTDSGCQSLEPLATTAVDGQGRFTFRIDASVVAGRRLLVEAVFDETGTSGARVGRGATTSLRSITFGPVAGGTQQVAIDPRSEAALRLLEELGLDAYSDQRIQGVLDAVAEANPSTSFAGLTVAEAVQKAQMVAENSLIVQARLGCAVDCNGDGQVTVDDLVIGVWILEPSACLAADGNGDGQITMAELVDGIRSLNANRRCRSFQIGPL